MRPLDQRWQHRGPVVCERERQARGVPGAEPGSSDDVLSFDGKRKISPQDEEIGAELHANPKPPGVAQATGARCVAKSGRAARFDLDFARHARGDAKNLAIRQQQPLVFGLGRDGHEVGDEHCAPLVWNRVSRMFVSAMYRRVTCAEPDGETRQWPLRSSSSAPKTDGLSKRGQHSQSIDPSRATSATVRPSPIAAYSSIGPARSRSKPSRW